MVKKLLLLLFFLLVIFGGAAELLLPSWTAAYGAESLKELTGSEQVTLQTEKHPAILMLSGQFDTVKIDAKNAKLDKLTVSSMQAELKGLQLDMNSLLLQRRFTVQSVDTVNLKAVVTEKELAQFLDANVKGSKNATVTVKPDKITVSSQLSLGGLMALSITLEGKIAADGQKIKFVTERFLLNHSPVGNLGGSILTEIPLADTKKLPFGTTIQNIVNEDGQIVIYAGNQSPASGKQ
ncbi:MAG: DUF2993 domain-containing protein [Sporomusaceae bacterium]|nr:DUF2993 domain-containing protein [Sporomusaceae bacterium]